jgi:hypothetical protein
MSVLLSHKRSLKIKIKVYVIRLYNDPARELRTEWQSHCMTIPLNNLGMSCAKLRRS